MSEIFASRFAFLGTLVALFLSGCFGMPIDPNYVGPKQRPASLEEYYGKNGTYGEFTVETLRSESEYELRKIVVQSGSGPFEIHYYQRPEASENIVLVFPVLGGKPVIESYFADYFAAHGMDSAIIVRQNDFKNPANVDRLEDIIRANVVRDRYALDFFEKEYGKKKFGSFGISRGAINAAVTAGIDPRLKHNVLVLGGSDLVKLFENSNQNRIKKYITTVTETKNITRAEFFASLAQNLKTDPKNFASYIDARHTLMILGLLDRTVPIKFGNLLREQIGNPRTIYLMADHYTSLLFTQIFPLLVPGGPRELRLFPFDYVESEAMHFYRTEMETGERTYKLVPFRLLRIPFDIVGRIFESVF